MVNNIEFDHADIYADLAAIRVAFQRFVNLIPRRGLLLLGADNAEAAALASRAQCRVETFGISDGADWQAHDLRVQGTSTTFSVRRRGEPIGSFELPLLGAFNVRNALAALAVERGRAQHRHAGDCASDVQGRQAPDAAAGHGGWSFGVRRLRAPPDRHRRDAGRRADGVSHRRCGRSSSRALRRRAAGSSIRFRACASAADTVVLPAVFRSNLPEDQRLSAEQLVADLKEAQVDARYIPQVDDIVTTVAKESREGDLVVIMSNGGFDDIHQKLLTALDARSRR